MVSFAILLFCKVHCRCFHFQTSRNQVIPKTSQITISSNYHTAHRMEKTSFKKDASAKFFSLHLDPSVTLFYCLFVFFWLRFYTLKSQLSSPFHYILAPRPHVATAHPFKPSSMDFKSDLANNSLHFASIQVSKTRSFLQFSFKVLPISLLNSANVVE